MIKFIENSTSRFTNGYAYQVISRESQSRASEVVALIEDDCGEKIWVTVDERWVAA